jgi:hypothetical protein
VRPVRFVIARAAVLSALVLLSSEQAIAGGFSRVHLVPAIAQCPGPETCVPRQFESAYTFDTILVMTPSGRYYPTSGPSLIVSVRGVRDPSHALLNGTLMLRLLSGRVSLPGLGTFPDGASLVQTPPVAIRVRKGNAHFSYKPQLKPPDGTITNGGGVEILDPTGKRLAVTGSQTRP